MSKAPASNGISLRGIWTLRLSCFALGLLSLLLPTAQAHSFGRVYNLPVPFWLYAWGAAAALLASFIVVGYFVSRGNHQAEIRSLNISNWRLVSVLRHLKLKTPLQWLSVSALVICIVTGWFGTRSPYGNFNMTFFWIWFVLGFAWLMPLLGNIYAALNPWQNFCQLIGKWLPRYANGLLPYPKALAYWPAFGFYMAFIWLELFGGTGPYSLAVILLVYSGINLIAAGLFGWRDWFRYGEFFAVFLRLLALMAPIDYAPRRHLRLRWPFAGLLQESAENISLVVFILFMLSSTAFDGLHETIPWMKLYWVELFHAYFSKEVSPNPLVAFPLMREWFFWYQAFWLFVSPFLYFAVYVLFVYLAKWLGRSEFSLRYLVLRFAYSLLPIALVYHVTHYYTLLITQGIRIVPLASDPFGKQWDLFGTADWYRSPSIPDMATVWHVQVGLIVLGHIISVVIAHMEALRLFKSHRLAVASQIPMLLLMVLFTTAGLWILAQPIQTGGLAG